MWRGKSESVISSFWSVTPSAKACSDTRVAEWVGAVGARERERWCIKSERFTKRQEKTAKKNYKGE